MKPVMESQLAAYIGGEWVKGKGTLASVNPANKKDIVASFGEADKALVRQAAQAARGAQKSWALTPAPVRAGIIQNFGKLIEENKEAWAKIVTREIGKPYREALGSVQEAIDTCNFFVSEGRRLYG